MFCPKGCGENRQSNEFQRDKKALLPIVTDHAQNAPGILVAEARRRPGISESSLAIARFALRCGPAAEYFCRAG